MDLKQYFRKVREAEATITEPYPLVFSLETSDGGKPGVVCQVSREAAAKMIVEGRSRLANEAEEKQYREQQALAKAVAEKAELAKRVQVAIVAEPHKPVDLPEQVKSPATKK